MASNEDKESILEALKHLGINKPIVRTYEFGTYIWTREEGGIMFSLDAEGHLTSVHVRNLDAGVDACWDIKGRSKGYEVRPE